jgi:hypothetical protein
VICQVSTPADIDIRCHDARVTDPSDPGTLILSRHIKAAQLFRPRSAAAVFVAIDDVDNGWQVAHPLKDIAIRTDVAAHRSMVTLTFWDDTPDRTVNGEVDVEVHTIAQQGSSQRPEGYGRPR